MNHFTHVDQFDEETFQQLIDRALEIKQHQSQNKRNDLTVVNMFFENSTRTKHSFEMAEHALGMNRLNFDVSSSSVSKGESLYDSLLTMKAIGVDVAVIRHPDNDFYQGLDKIGIHLVNAGAGSGEHPSQCLLDAMTIQEEFGTISGRTIAIVGDLQHSRVARSNARLFSRMGARLLFAGPEVYYDAELENYGKYLDIDEAVKEADVVMMLRVQFERHDDDKSLNEQSYLNRYGLSTKRYETLQEHAIIMHPAPVNRGIEIDTDLVECAKSRIVRQMENGVFARMAILEWVVK